jgi:hypothetical protein
VPGDGRLEGVTLPGLVEGLVLVPGFVEGLCLLVPVGRVLFVPGLAEGVFPLGYLFLKSAEPWFLVSGREYVSR